MNERITFEKNTTVVDKMGAATGQFADSLSSLGNHITSLGNTFGSDFAVSVGTGISRIGSAINDVAGIIREVGQMKDSLQTVAQTFSGLNSAIGSTGTSYPIWFCPTSALNNGKAVCHAEKIYEEQAVRMFRKAFTDRFHLLSQPVLDDVKVADIMSGRYGEEDSPLCGFDQRADSFVEQIRQRLVNIQKMDFMERDRGFLKRQIEAIKVTVAEATDRCRILSTQRDTMEIRRDLLNDETVDDRELAALKDRIEGESVRIREAEEDKEKLEQRLTHLERYWEQLEAGHEERDRALEWIGTLPKGREGTIAFLNGLTSTYVKAFALSITVHDPLHYTVHWFDDTRTDVEMYSNVEDYRCTAAYFDGQRMREKYRRKG